MCPTDNRRRSYPILNSNVCVCVCVCVCEADGEETLPYKWSPSWSQFGRSMDAEWLRGPHRLHLRLLSCTSPQAAYPAV